MTQNKVFIMLKYYHTVLSDCCYSGNYFLGYLDILFNTFYLAFFLTTIHTCVPFNCNQNLT